MHELYWLLSNTKPVGEAGKTKLMLKCQELQFLEWSIVMDWLKKRLNSVCKKVTMPSDVGTVFLSEVELFGQMAGLFKLVGKKMHIFDAK